jgi:hypothetical protein
MQLQFLYSTCKGPKKQSKGFDLQPNHQVFKIRKTPTPLSKSDSIKDMPSGFRENSKN